MDFVDYLLDRSLQTHSDTSNVIWMHETRAGRRRLSQQLAKNENQALANSLKSSGIISSRIVTRDTVAAHLALYKEAPDAEKRTCNVLQFRNTLNN